jgi:transcriptional regulator with GAF, ATPase, and Fis domain
MSGLRDAVLDGGLPFDEAEAAFERQLIVDALARSGFVQTRAAQLLGISRRILKYKMDKLGIREPAA